MATGKVKWFNNAKGYGFILPEEGGEDLFAHYSSIQMEGYKTLKAGQDVEFEILEGPKGSHAVNIRADTDAGTGKDTDPAARSEPETPTELPSGDDAPGQSAAAASTDAHEDAEAAEEQPAAAAQKSSELASS